MCVCLSFCDQKNRSCIFCSLCCRAKHQKQTFFSLLRYNNNNNNNNNNGTPSTNHSAICDKISSSSSEQPIALTLGVLGVGELAKSLFQLTESHVLEGKIAVAFIANSKKSDLRRRSFRPNTTELLETLFDGTNDLAIWARIYTRFARRVGHCDLFESVGTSVVLDE